MRVPRRNTGAGHSLVTRSGTNEPGVKGMDYPAGFRGQPCPAGEELVGKNAPGEVKALPKPEYDHRLVF